MTVKGRISTMARHSGEPSSALWLLGDSEPQNFCDRLEVPLDRRHPARHNIWTPILDVIQAHAFREALARLDDSKLYVRNAVKSPQHKPRQNVVAWQGEVESDLREFKALLARHHPRLVLCFGAFAWEFARRAQGENPSNAHADWGALTLGTEFVTRVSAFKPSQVNIVPLLHVSIARGRFLESHRDFCSKRGTNYFDFVGRELAQVLLDHRDIFNVWLTR